MDNVLSSMANFYDSIFLVIYGHRFCCYIFICLAFGFGATYNEISKYNFIVRVLERRGDCYFLL